MGIGSLRLVKVVSMIYSYTGQGRELMPYIYISARSLHLSSGERTMQPRDQFGVNLESKAFEDGMLEGRAIEQKQSLIGWSSQVEYCGKAPSPYFAFQVPCTATLRRNRREQDAREDVKVYRGRLAGRVVSAGPRNIDRRDWCLCSRYSNLTLYKGKPNHRTAGRTMVAFQWPSSAENLM